MMMISNYQKNGIIGIDYLIKYIRKREKKYLHLANQYKNEIRFWTLITLFQNNHELIFDSVDLSTLKDLFEMKKILKAKSNLLYDDATYYDYGLGIVTNSKLDYISQFRIIRNSIAHNNFFINDDGTLTINMPNYEAVIDIKWLEATIMCCLSTRNYQFRSGLHDSFLITLNRDDEASKEKFLMAIDDKSIGTIKISLDTNSIKKVCDVMMIKEGNYTFHDIYNYIRDIIQLRVNEMAKDKNDIAVYEYLSIIKKVIDDLNKQYSGALTIAYVPFTRNFSFDLIDMEEFGELERYRDQAEVLLNHYKREMFPELENTLAFKYICDVLTLVSTNNELTPIYELYLTDAYSLLIKSLGNLTFNSLVSNMEGYKTISSRIFNRYKALFSYDFGHAKNHYKEIIKKLKNALSDARKNGFPFERFKELKKYEYLISSLEEKIRLISSGANPEVFINQLRNIFTHGYCHAGKDSIKIYDIKPDTHYFKYSKDKKSWEEKNISGSVIFNAEITYEVFMQIIRGICDEYDIPFDDSSFNKSVKRS